jgi:hypothetical protein
MLTQAVRELAFELRLPWKVEQLFEAGKQGVRAALDNNSDSRALGLPPEQLLNARIRQEIGMAGRTMQAQAAADGETRPPSEQEMENALEAFDAEQWKVLIQCLGQVDVETLRSHLQQNTDNLKQRFGARKIKRLEAFTIMRDIELWLKDNRSKLVPISDAYWAVGLADAYRLESIKRVNPDGRASNAKSLAEQAGDRATARHLKKHDKVIDREMSVSPYQVKQWRQRQRALPFEDFDGDFLTYLVTIYYPEAYKSYLRSKGSKYK